ncbi:hypothetical protein SCLCIDRAFT_1193691 [Scleroderma citrinum Foug A]|uniref:Ubiquitin-like protease family profile domain-containing protein n=1 Tax=Scleroderma citrinum Foug A TaxID=1036808 RepID=A0A0C3DMR8_9AGAM|nr:hypothetical protein SCLCIDRAFT_1193691 [Scleroderma citrinum Foug A]
MGSESLLCRQVRLVRNIELHYTDLLPLIEPGRKIPGSTLNAYGAIIQDTGTNLLVLSSWIPALASGTTEPYYAEGTIEDHVRATGVASQDIVQYPRWQVPLLGGSLSHWVLGIVNFSMKVLGIYDSIPELRSQEWAVPVSVLWIHKLVTNNTIQKLLQTTVDAVAELAC